ncbi:hypothetical protein E2C01_041537 [Portunus trituberculatus]|uniref:Uncharacterized protein n=1 Tax=Portunus trituberculatus TaxID=210409 RepID=A0A5B7FJI3_PORTR|nr:hypothetical protein [Portunus trituberculatus]
MNNDMKKTLDKTKRENSILKGKFEAYEVALQGLQEKLDTNVGTGEGISKAKLEEWKMVWKKKKKKKSS